jgi:hypothetical protein
VPRAIRKSWSLNLGTLRPALLTSFQQLIKEFPRHRRQPIGAALSLVSAGAISSPRSTARSCLSLHVLAQCSIDTRLIALIGGRVVLEPGDHIGVDAKC